MAVYGSAYKGGISYCKLQNVSRNDCKYLIRYIKYGKADGFFKSRVIPVSQNVMSSPETNMTVYVYVELYAKIFEPY